MEVLKMQQCKEMCLLTMYHLGFVEGVQTRIVFFVCFPQLNGTGSFSFGFWCKRVPWALFFCWKLFLFSLGIEIQPIATCLQLCTCPFRIFHHLSSSFPFFKSKKKFGAFGVSNVWTLPPNQPETRQQYGMSDSSYEHRCGLESSVIWRWYEMIEGLETFECFKFNT